MRVMPVRFSSASSTNLSNNGKKSNSIQNQAQANSSNNNVSFNGRFSNLLLTSWNTDRVQEHVANKGLREVAEYFHKQTPEEIKKASKTYGFLSLFKNRADKKKVNESNFVKLLQAVTNVKQEKVQTMEKVSSLTTKETLNELSKAEEKELKEGREAIKRMDKRAKSCDMEFRHVPAGYGYENPYAKKLH